MKLVLTALLIGLLTNPLNWELNFDQAKTEAAQSHKFILLNFSGSDWCGPCIKLKKTIFESAEFSQYAADHLVLVRADFPRLSKNQLDARQIAHNETLAEKYNKQGKFPLTVLLDANGKVLKEWDGYPQSLTVSSFLETIDSVTSIIK
ncbi:thioredoxin family protein [Spirosoma sp. KCTC 42546]|uniref:thioredoxin family protein n=1 Tax=Spirosoma sp. KCTC 42546 TaxID=2520506 RepID=UPI001159EE38|nr:thioredoxin family protein [Spirosoma sp. KCTC 42546]QDK79813.1 thioredoxin family protein [Spirosoma sp. KCTC 42546]